MHGTGRVKNWVERFGYRKQSKTKKLYLPIPSVVSYKNLCIKRLWKQIVDPNVLHKKIIFSKDFRALKVVKRRRVLFSIRENCFGSFSPSLWKVNAEDQAENRWHEKFIRCSIDSPTVSKFLVVTDLSQWNTGNIEIKSPMMIRNRWKSILSHFGNQVIWKIKKYCRLNDAA